jgi:hypothetical protein
VRVGEHLRLDVAWPVEELLDEALPAPEGGDRLAHRRVEELRDLAELARDLESTAPAAEGRLDGDRQAELAGERDGSGRVIHRVGGARDERRPHPLGDPAGRHLVSQEVDALRRRSDPDEAGLDDGGGES